MGGVGGYKKKGFVSTQNKRLIKPPNPPTERKAIVLVHHFLVCAAIVLRARPLSRRHIVALGKYTPFFYAAVVSFWLLSAVERANAAKLMCVIYRNLPTKDLRGRILFEVALECRK